MNSFDTNITNQSFLQFNMANGLMSSGTYASASNLVSNSTDNVYGNVVSQIASAESSLKNNIKDYLNETKQYIILNDLANNNDYVAQTLKGEMDKTEYMRDKTINTTYKTQQNFFQKKWTIDYNHFLSNILKFLIIISIFVVTTIAFMKSETINKTIGYAIITCLVSLTSLVIFVYFKNMQTRRKDDWNKYYFSSMQSDNSNSCTAKI